ncbi:MAG: hypothetical protein JWM74_1266 [Myxococcaceae bacterium]|jgi:hypothetical protein|nr:hypothetical protein [Myxococcaceae bacterium]
MTDATILHRSLAADPLMRTMVWVLQLALAGVFLYTGVLHVFGAEMPVFLRLVGIAELIGAVGLIVPAATRILPSLTALAACGLTMIMTAATVHHFSRDELAPQALITIALGTLTAFVAWSRLIAAPVTPRGHTHPPSLRPHHH